MAERTAMDDRRRRASLLSLARPARLDPHPSAVERHRIARARFEAEHAWTLDTDEGEDSVNRTGQNRAEDAVPPAGERRAPGPGTPPVIPVPVIAPPPPIVVTPPPQERLWRPLIEPMFIVKGVLRSKRLILVATVAGAALGAAYALSTPKKYEAAAELLIDPRDLRIADNALTQGDGLPSDATLAIVENQVRVITSGSVLHKVVEKLHLDRDPEFNGMARSFGLRGLLGELRSALSPGRSDKADDRFAIAMENLGDALHVERAGKTFVVTIGATTKEPEKSATIANTVIGAFLETYGTLQSGTAGRATEEITARLDELRKSVQEAERKVEDYRSRHDLVDAQGRLIGDDEIVKLNDQLTVAKARTLELNARAASARQVGVDEVVGGALPEQVASPVLTELRAQYAALKQQADAATVKFGPRHPQRLQIEAQLQGLRDQIAQQLRTVASSIQVELKRAVELEQGLAARLAQLKARQGRVNDELVALRELERDANSKRAVYEAYLLRAQQTGEQQGINTANMSVISQAAPPLQPEGTSRAVITLAGAFLGFLAGLGLGGLRGAVEGLRGPGSEPPASPEPEPAPASATDPEPGNATIHDIIAAVRARHMPAAAPPSPAPETGDRDASVPESSSAEPAEPRSVPENPSNEDTAMGAHPTQFDPSRAYAPQPAQPGYGHAQPYPQPQAWMPAQPQPLPPGYPVHAYGQPGFAPPQDPAAWAPQPVWYGYGAPPQAPAYGWPHAHAPQAWQQPGWQARPEPEPRGIRDTLERRDLTVEEIRDSLREVREAIRELAEARRARMDYDQAGYDRLD